MLQIHDLAASIVVDGYPLEEFGVDLVDNRTVRCYIPSEAGQTFEIWVTNQLPSHLITFRIHTDGSDICGQLCEPGCAETCKGVTTSPVAYRPMAFANLQLTDDDRILLHGSGPSWDKLGMIELRAYRCQRIGEETAYQDNVRALGNGPVHEQSKKSGTHCVSFRDEVRESRKNFRVVYLDRADEPFARFQFVYRPRALLQAQGIIPRTHPQVAAHQTGYAPQAPNIPMKGHSNGFRAAINAPSNQPAGPSRLNGLGSLQPYPEDSKAFFHGNGSALNVDVNVKTEPSVYQLRGAITSPNRSTTRSRPEVIDLTLDDD